MVELYTGGETDLAAGPHAVFLVNGTARAADRDVWIVQCLAARVEQLPADEAGQVEAVRAAILARFAGPGAVWVEGAEVRLAVSTWPPPAEA
jgi:hypothetical protein